MKIKFLGVGSAFTTADYYQSNMLLTARNGRRMLIDCGGDIRFSLSECGIRFKWFAKDIDAIYISHLHADHIGGLEGVAYNTFFDEISPGCTLFIPESLEQDLWENCLKGGLQCVQDREMRLDDYFVCAPIAENGPFQWQGISFSLVKMIHISERCRNPYSFGLVIKDGPRSVFISTDARFQPDLLARISENVDLMFHDCETQRVHSGVHAHFNDLRTLSLGLKQKMWLYHYQPNPTQKPEQEGFKGFVVKGQEFDL
jgi:ribonuclease BN (tRNA processing enzyme)